MNKSIKFYSIKDYYCAFTVVLVDNNEKNDFTLLEGTSILRKLCP